MALAGLKRALLLLPLLLLGACSGDETGTAATDETTSPILRVLMPSHLQGMEYLPRNGRPDDSDEYRLIELYAATRNARIEKVYIDSYDQMIPALLEGKGEIIVNNMTVTETRKAQVNFTSPVAFVREQLIGRTGETPKSAHDLKERKVAVHRSDAYFETLTQLHRQRFQPPFEIIEIEEGVSTDQIIQGVRDGAYDLTVVDSNQWDTMAQHDGLEIGFDIGTVRPIAWAVAKENTALLHNINDFLGRHHLAGGGEFISTGDLDKIKQQQVLRVLTRNNASTYYLWQGELQGFEYDLVKRFADQHQLRLEMVVPPSRDQLIPWLQQGKGDLIAAAMSITDERQQQGVAFSRPYNTIEEMVVSRSDDPISSPEQLNGRRVVVRRSSSYWQGLEALQQQGIGVELIPADEGLETEELIDQVASGEIDLTVADSHILDIELTWRSDVHAAFSLGEHQHGWVMRQDNPALLQAVNAFHNKEYRGLFYNVTYEKYFKDPKQILNHQQERGENSDNGTLSPYDALVKKHAEQYGFDWRLIVSQMYQESRFNTKAKSWAGALGLLQVLPRTAREFGIGELQEPDNGLHAGMKYLNWLRQRFEPKLDIGERTWFALASYNAGIGHVRDARTLAARQGWDPNRWFGNVEKAMLLLAKKGYAKQAKHGYVRGHEPVNYVQQIRDRYLAYLSLNGEEQLARSE